jgi:endonuclease/exonuclease/phosphatase family metal-dependent hydrolase
MRLPASRRARVRAERRVRRGLRAGLATVAVATIGVGVGLTALPATATSSPSAAPPLVRVVGGNHQVTVGWSKVTGATGYTVRLSTSSTMSKAKVVTTTKLSWPFKKLLNGHKYYARVTPQGLVQKASAQSTVKVAKATSAMPLPISGLKLTPVSKDILRVTWTGGGNATKVAVIAGSMSLTDVNHFATSWRAATTRKIDLHVPDRLKAALGGGSGNYIFVKVAQSNSMAADPTKYLHYDYASKFVLSQSGNLPPSYGLAGSAAVPSTPAPPQLTVASWNVQGITASESFTPANQWKARLPRVAANIEDVKPDLVGLQELGTVRMKTDCTNKLTAIAGFTPHCQEQYESLQSALGTAAVPYRNARTDAWKWVYNQPGGATGGAYVESMLFYNPQTLSVGASGFVSPRTTLKVANWPSDKDQAGMWAVFTMAGTGQRFLAASIHLPVMVGAKWDAIRQDEATKLAAFLDGKATQPDGTKLPIVLTGDFNANGATDAHAGSLVLRGKDYFDTAATTNRAGQRYSSSNGTNGTDYPKNDEGYPVHAAIHKYATSRIDYILTKGSPYTYWYKNLVRIKPGTTNVFDTRYNGSDHNLQVARIGIANPLPAS